MGLYGAVKLPRLHGTEMSVSDHMDHCQCQNPFQFLSYRKYLVLIKIHGICSQKVLKKAKAVLVFFRTYDGVCFKNISILFQFIRHKLATS